MDRSWGCLAAWDQTYVKMLNLGREEKGNWINGNRLHDAISTNHRLHVSIWPLLHPLTSAPRSTRCWIYQPRRAHTEESIKVRTAHSQEKRADARTKSFNVFAEKSVKIKSLHLAQSTRIHTHTRHNWPHTICYSMISIASGRLLYHKQWLMFNNWLLSISAPKGEETSPRGRETRQIPRKHNTVEIQCNKSCTSKTT